MKNTVQYFVYFIVLILVLISCNNKDEHSLGAFHINIATVLTESDNTYSLLLDNGKRLWPAATDVKYAAVNNQRVFVNYTTLSNEKDGYDHFVKNNDIWNILTKDIIALTPQNADSIGHDPIKINAVWVGNNYLNIDFMFNYGGFRPHAINLTNNMFTSDSTSGVVNLELRHNAYDSSDTRLHEGFVCFDLRPLQKPNVDSVKLAVKVKDWDEEKTYNVVYRYNQPTLQNTFAETPIPVISSNEYY